MDTKCLECSHHKVCGLDTCAEDGCGFFAQRAAVDAGKTEETTTTVEMRLQRRDDGRYELTINGKHIGTFNSIEKFAERIEEYGQKTLRDIENRRITED